MFCGYPLLSVAMKWVLISFNHEVQISFFLFLCTNICCVTHQKCLAEMLLMSIHNACFSERTKEYLS